MNLPRLLLVVLSLAAAWCVMAPTASQAQTIEVTVNPTRLQIPVNAPATVTVTWRIVRTSTILTPGTSSSANARVTVGGMTVATVGSPLARSFPGNAIVETAFLTETVVIPQAAAFRAVKSGLPVLLTRTFNDTAFPSDTASATLVPSGPGSEPFSVSRLDLRFEDQTRVKVLPKNSRLRAVAELNTTGNGQLRAVWEFASAVTTAGAPVFQTLALVRQPVVFGRRLVLYSPPLPTRFEGTNLVRLRITDPDFSFDTPQLQYYVTPESPLPELQEPRLMLVTAPAPGTPLTLTTRFAWQAVPGARLYKVELFEAPPGPDEGPVDNVAEAGVPLNPAPDGSTPAGQAPLTGIVVPGAITEVRLKDFSLAHLAPDRRYLWTVKAVAPDGAILGASVPREIYKP